MSDPITTPLDAPALPTAPVIVGDNSIAWGTSGIYTGGGLVESASIVGNAEAQKVFQNKGFTASVVFFDQNQEIELTATVEGTAPSFSPGDSVTVCGVAGCIVQPGGFKVMYNQKGVAKFSLKVVKYALF